MKRGDKIIKQIGKYALIAISIIIGLAMLITIFNQIPFLDVKQSFQEATSFSVIGFVVISIILMVLFSWRWKTIIDTKKKIPFRRIFAYNISGYGVSFITPAAKVGGEPLRAMFLQREGMTFNQGFSTVVTDKLIDVTTSGTLFIIGIFAAISSYALPNNATLLLVIFTVIITLMLVWFYFRLISDKNILLTLFRIINLHKIKKLKKIENNIIEMDNLLMQFYKVHKQSFNKAFIISTAAWFLMFIEYKLALMIVGIDSISFAGLFLIITMMGASYLLPIPLALGVLEAGQVSIFSVLKLNSAAGFSLATIIRTRDFIWTIVGIIILIAKGINFRKAYDKSIKEGGIKIPRKTNNQKKINKK